MCPTSPLHLKKKETRKKALFKLLETMKKQSERLMQKNEQIIHKRNKNAK